MSEFPEPDPIPRADPGAVQEGDEVASPEATVPAPEAAVPSREEEADPRPAAQQVPDEAAIQADETSDPNVRIEYALAVRAQGSIEAPQARFGDIDDAKLYAPGAMVPKFNWFTRAFAHVMFRRVAFDERHQQTLRDADRDGNLVIAMNHHSKLDYLYFNYAFLRFGLPRVFFCSKMSLTGFRPLWRQMAHGFKRLFRRFDRRLNNTELLTYGIERKRPALIFLKRRGIWPWATGEAAGNTYLKTVLALQKDRIATSLAKGNGRPMPIRVVPQLLVWSQDPDRYRRSRLRSLVFGDPDAPGPARKVINFVLNRRRAFVQLGRPIDLVDFLERQPDNATPDQLARQLRYEIHKSLNREERVIKGPILKPAKRLREEILRTREMGKSMNALAEQLGKPPEQVEAKISKYIKEIAADFSISYIEFMCIMLTVVLDRIYSEVVPDLKGLEGVREAARKGPLVLLPCHRSHVDYLVLSYLFYANGLIPPHIAAGANLNFFPMGHIFRRSGAFFIRRSFKDNPQYSLAFREYLRKLIKEGYWIEFFLEGGRSRTGKMLPPKYGMLRRIVDAIESGAAPDVHFVPIYVGYEQIIEERAYSRELAGEAKKKENITQLLRTTKVLWSRYGRLYVNFGKPFSCREALDAAALPPDRSPADHDRFVRRLAYQVMRGINRVALITPSAAVAMALLIHPQRGLRRERLLARVGFILEMAQLKAAPLSKTLQHALKIHRQEVAAAMQEMREAGLRDQAVSLGEDSPLAKARGNAVVEAVDEALTHLIAKKQVHRHSFESDPTAETDADIIYTPVPARRISLDYYKNNIVHLFVDEAILAAAIRANMEGGKAPVDKVREDSRTLSEMFKHEFVYEPSEGFDTRFETVLKRGEETGFLIDAIEPDGSRVISVEPRAQPTLLLMHRVLAPWIEGYWVVARSLAKLAETTAEKDFLRKSQKGARLDYEEGRISCPEAGNTVTFKNAIMRLTELEFAKRTKKGRETLLGLGREAVENPEALTELAENLRRFFTFPWSVG